MMILNGIGVSGGIACAAALKYAPVKIVVDNAPCADPETEAANFQRALEEVSALTEGFFNEACKKSGEAEAAIFEAHLMLLRDEDSVVEPILQRIGEGYGAVAAVDAHFDVLIGMMEALDDAYLRERAEDFREIKRQLLQSILKIEQPSLSELASDVIVVAHELTPADTIRMDLKHIRGIVSETGGPTAHTAILARAMGIPAVTGCADAMDSIAEGEELLLDGTTGTIVVSANAAEKERFAAKAAAAEAEKRRLAQYCDRKSVSRDGRTVKICGNIGSPEECAAVMENGGEGIGLFRTEFLYMGGAKLPDEDLQTAAYRKTLETAGGRTVTIRTLDAGGDKAIVSLGLPKENNPFLGYRAIRVCLDRKDLFKTQLRALYRASVAGTLRIMFPMISSLEELFEAKRIAAEVRAELDAEKIRYDPQTQIGMMVEVPAAAVLADLFAKEVDFFSIGTNDLIQYSVAVDRGNDRIRHLYSPYHPAVIRLIADTIDAAHKNGIPCCMCGEAAGDPDFVPVLLGLGLDDFSVSGASILRIREQISKLSGAACTALRSSLLAARTVAEVRTVLGEFAQAQSL